MWLKYRTTHAHGYGELQWHYLGERDMATTKAEAEELIAEINSKHDWSEHYRGVEYDILPTAPVEILDKEIHQANNEITGRNMYVAILLGQRARALKADSSEPWSSAEIVEFIGRLLRMGSHNLDRVSALGEQIEVEFRIPPLGPDRKGWKDGEPRTLIGFWLTRPPSTDGRWRLDVSTSTGPVRDFKPYLAAMRRVESFLQALLSAGIITEYP